MPRKTKPWVGRTDDSRPPPKVRQRVFDRDDGVCHICGEPISLGETWHMDHVIALILGGANEENNLAPTHAGCNLAKSQTEKKVKSKIAKIRQRHIGVKTAKVKLQNRGFAKSVGKKSKPSLPPRKMFK